MDNCKHVNKFNLAFNHSVLDPQKWHCHVCGTADTLWACLSCPNVACGILSKGHAFKHFKEKQHALTLEVNDQSIYCYECGDCVYNDNAASDLKVLRSALSAITTHNFLNLEHCNRRFLRSSYQRRNSEKSQRNHDYKYCSIRSSATDDKLDTALWHRRQRMLCKVFQAWKALVLKLNTKPKAVAIPETKVVKMSSCAVHKKTLIPGVTGLRNLGNTCYMNSILQVLGHLEKFRHFFVNMPFPPTSGSCGSSPLSSCPHNSHHSNSSGAINSAANCRNFNNHINNRHTSVECFQRSSPRSGGLNGGATHQQSVHQKLLSISQTIEPKLLRPEKRVSLCEELRALFHVLWSGKWTVVSPNTLLQAMWSYIPAFRGYSQQDAQEFLSQLLDKVQTELDDLCYMKNYRDVVADTFQGELVSEVTCQSCGHKCQTYEPFMDLSLEFPARYQRNSPNGKIASNVCHITEMLSHFTKPEYLEGKVYACDSCNSRRKRPNTSPKIYTEIKKQLLLSKLPHILRLHLKRFRWSKGNHREKIATHVSFENFLNMKPFCLPQTLTENGQTQFLYKLSAIIIHHGQGFGSGHYTAFCWSKEANSWIHCNDTRVQQVSIKEVFKSQVYILIFSLHSTRDHQTDSCSLPRTISNSNTSNDHSNNRVPNNDNTPSPPLVTTPAYDPATSSNTLTLNNSTTTVNFNNSDTPITTITLDTINTPIMTASPNISFDTCLASASPIVTSTAPINSTVTISPNSYMNLNSTITSKDKDTNLMPFVLVHTPPKKSTSFLLQRLGLSSHIGNTYETRSKLPRLRSSVVQRKSITPQIVNSVDRKRKSDRPQNIMGKTKKHRITL